MNAIANLSGADVTSNVTLFYDLAPFGYHGTQCEELSLTKVNATVQDFMNLVAMGCKWDPAQQTVYIADFSPTVGNTLASIFTKCNPNDCGGETISLLPNPNNSPANHTWKLFLNKAPAAEGMSYQVVETGDTILWKYAPAGDQ